MEVSPLKSALFIVKAAKLGCPMSGNCVLCEYSRFCGAVARAYEEALPILKKNNFPLDETDRFYEHVKEDEGLDRIFIGRPGEMGQS